MTATGHVPPGVACALCGKAHTMGSAQDWGGGVRPVCVSTVCELCGKDGSTSMAMIDRVLVCDRCTLRRAATVARMALARRAGGAELSVVDRRCLNEMESRR